MHNVWGVIEWGLNTLISLLASLIIGNRVLQKANPIDWFYMLLLYAVLMVVRAITLMTLYPFIANIDDSTPVTDGLKFLLSSFPGINFCSDGITHLFCFLETRKEKCEVYMLTSFFE